MGRSYEHLECGCLISCDGGGGLIPCSYIDENLDCKAQEYFNQHHQCEKCGECVVCYCQCNGNDAGLDELVKWYFECINLNIDCNDNAFYEIIKNVENALERLRQSVGMEEPSGN